MKKFLSTLFFAMSCSFAIAGNFPEKPVKIIVPSGPGGGLDVIARIFSKNLSELWKNPVIVENRPAADGTIAGNLVINGDSDGHTLLFYTTGAYASLQALDKKYEFSWEEGLTPLSSLHSAPFVLVVSSKSKTKNFEDFRKNHNGEVTFGSTGLGSPTHVYGEAIIKKVGAKPILVNYKTVGQSLTDVIAGNLDSVVFNSTLIKPHVESGSVVPILIFSDKQMADFPNVPTIKGVGYSEFSNLIVSYNFFVSSKVSENMKEKLKKDIHKATLLSLQELREKRMIDSNFTPREDFNRELEQITNSWKNATSKLNKN